MKKLFNLKNIFSLFVAFSFLFAGFNFAFAAPNLDNLSGLGGGFEGSNGGTVNKIATKGNIATTSDFPTVINNIISISLGIFATILLGIIVYSGIKMITSKGKIETYQLGLKLLKTAVIAMLIVLLSYVISNFVLKSISLVTK